MMIISCSDTQQDTVKGRNIVLKDSFGIKSDSASIIKTPLSNDSVIHKLESAPKTAVIDFTDSTSVCGRNSIADITFYDSNNIVTKLEPGSSNGSPFLFIQKNKEMQIEARASLMKHLKTGQDLPVQPHHEDWRIWVILIAVFLYSLIRTTSKSMLPGVSRFFLLRGINDPSSRDIGGLFHWQSTILNLISFLIIGLFAYCVSSYYDFIPSGIRGIIFWLISVGIVISAVTLRHIVCLITGNASGEKEVFMEYLLGVYQSYRFSALFLFILIILMSYTALFPVRVYFISGIIVLGIIYLVRVSRLMIIFINRNISIFYLILYLCALEILPVLISVKYFTGLV
jgi:hypothetical protein